MDKVWKDLLLAASLGLLIPHLVSGIVDAFDREEDPVISPVETAVPETVVVENVVEVVYLPVVMADGRVRILELEDYVRGVVLAEMPASFEMEALKAQAVAARTYVLRRLTVGSKHSQGVICTDYHCCQAYLTDEEYILHRGVAEDISKIARAVAQTRGQVLTYGGELIEATYFACSGGRTEDAIAVWGEEIPYLQSVPSPGETKGERYDQVRYFSANEFAQALDRRLSGSPKYWIDNISYTTGGGVAELTICGERYSGIWLRKRLDLNSTLFTIQADGDGITIHTKGWGHRVGMSQYGADAMALTGSSYREILGYYYPGTTIDKLSDVQ